MFYSVRTAKNKNTQHSAANHIHLSMLNAMDLINLSITERKHDAAKKTPRGIHQGLLLRKTSLILISSSVLTVRKTIKQTVIHILIGENVSTKSSMIENNRNSTRIKYSNVAIMLSLSIVFFFFFFSSILFFNFNTRWMVIWFTDAEGCFNVKIDKRSNTVTGFRVMVRFNLAYAAMSPI